MPKHLPIRPVFSQKRWKNHYEYWDEKNQQWTKCSGFQIDIWEPTSQQRFRITEHVDYQSAKQLYHEWQDLALRGEFEPIARAKKEKVNTIADLSSKWIDTVSKPTYYREIPLSPETIRRTGTAIRALCKTVRGTEDSQLRLKDITPTMLDRFCRMRLDCGVSREGINADLRQLRALINWGRKQGLLERDPFACIEFFQTRKPVPRPLTRDELIRLFQVCPPGSRFYNLLMFYLITGARRSQAAKPYLRWDGIDFKEGFIYLVRQKQKERTFPITPELNDILLDIKEHPIEKRANRRPDDYLYPFPFSPSHISNKIFRPMLAQAKIEGATLHDLRKTCLTVLKHDLGYQSENVKDYIGHSSVAVTEAHYIGRSNELQQEMGCALGSYMINLAKNAAKVVLGTDTLVLETSKTVTQNSDKDVLNPPQKRPKPLKTETPTSRREEGESPVGSGGGTRTPDTRIMIPLL